MTRTPSILIVDDDEDIRDIFQFVLEADGYCVDVAVDGVDAWKQLISGRRPALILLDLMMPRMDGEQFLKKLHGSPFSEVPVVILSGNNTAQKRMLELRVNSWLTKPVECEELLNTVKRFVPVPWKKNEVA